MIDPTTVSMIRDIVAIFGVIAGFTYYVMTVRINQRAMRINLTNNLIQQIGTDEFIKKLTELLYMEWDDYDDFERKYGSDVDLDNYVKRIHVWTRFDSLGQLLMKGQADKEILYHSQVVYNSIHLWHKYQDVLEVNRKLYSGADAWTGLEYLANEMYKIKQEKDPAWNIGSTDPRYDEERRNLANR
jgi:hypothetical protein